MQTASTKANAETKSFVKKAKAEVGGCSMLSGGNLGRSLAVLRGIVNLFKFWLISAENNQDYKNVDGNLKFLL